MDITLTPELEKIVQARMARREGATAQEIVAEALLKLPDDDDELFDLSVYFTPEEIEEIERSIEEGRKGPFLTQEEFEAKWLHRYALHER